MLSAREESREENPLSGQWRPSPLPHLCSGLSKEQGPSEPGIMTLSKQAFYVAVASDELLLSCITSELF